MSNGTEDLVLACECGSTVKVSSLDPIELKGYEIVFRAKHEDALKHNLVPCAAARDIRAAERKRR